MHSGLLTLLGELQAHSEFFAGFAVVVWWKLLLSFGYYPFARLASYLWQTGNEQLVRGFAEVFASADATVRSGEAVECLDLEGEHQSVV